MTQPTEAEVEAGAHAIRWLADEAVDPVEVARDVLTAVAQMKANSAQQIAHNLAEKIKTRPHMSAPDLMPIYDSTEDQGPDVLGLRKGEE